MLRSTIAAIVWLVGCGPDSGATQESTDDAGTSALASSTGAGSSGGDSSGAPEVGPCGDGVVDAGEACDDGSDGCDACTDRCTLLVEPVLEWDVALAPMAQIRAVDMTQAGRFYVLGDTADAAPLLHTVEQSGVTHTVDLAALGLTRIFAFQVNGAASDGAEVGILAADADGKTQAARLGPDGVIGEWLTLEGEFTYGQMAVTSAGLTLLNYKDVFRVSPTGDVTGPFESFDAYALDALGDRLVFMGSSSVVLTDPDGGARVDVPCSGGRLATGGSHVVWSEAQGDGQIVMGSCELASGEQSSGVVASGEGGLESGDSVVARDAAPNGNPIGAWSICPFGGGSFEGCQERRERGFGGPGDPRALELDACDDGATALVAADRSVYMIRRDPDTGTLRLVRRWALPDRAPWN